MSVSVVVVVVVGGGGGGGGRCRPRCNRLNGGKISRRHRFNDLAQRSQPPSAASSNSTP